MRRAIQTAIDDSDTFVIAMDYRDAKGGKTHRVVSPIRFLGNDRFLGLCLCREEPRQFYLDRCSEVRLMQSADVLMAVAVG
jgi:predicted DNA-binding transcriptional regulator YafY